VQLDLVVSRGYRPVFEDLQFEEILSRRMRRDESTGHDE
jgi:hypothetical protein